MTVEVHVTVLAPPRPAPLHWLTPVTGVVEVVVPDEGQTAEPVQLMSVTIVARPVGRSGVAALYAKLLVTVTSQVMVSPPDAPVLLHWLITAGAALAWDPPTRATARPAKSAKPKTATRSRATRVFIEFDQPFPVERCP